MIFTDKDILDFVLKFFSNVVSLNVELFRQLIYFNLKIVCLCLHIKIWYRIMSRRDLMYRKCNNMVGRFVF